MQATTIDRITKTPGVCGGSACVRGHRIPVWLLVGYRKLGLTNARLLEYYPSIEQPDLEAAWEYYEANHNEIEQDIRENEEGDEGLVGE